MILMCQRCHTLWLIVCVSLLSFNRAHAQDAGVFQDCGTAVNISISCTWRTRQAVPGAVIIRGSEPEQGGLKPPVLLAADAGQAASQPAVQGFTLSLRRLLLANVTLAPPNAAGVPALWPLQLFTAPPANFSMRDVRVFVSDADFKTYLDFFQANGTEAVFYTDGLSFLHIGSWESGSTVVNGVTLVSGPCTPHDSTDYAALAVAAAAAPNCAIRIVTNSTLIPVLLQEASKTSQQALLVLITANVSLGVGLAPGAIPIRRHVIMAGLYSRPTSVDCGMVVNQLNVTEQYAKMYWQSLVLENVAPGNALTAVIAAPYGVSVSANVWALYCSRNQPCLNLRNTTTVVATAAESDYLTFMFSMFNSPLPSMRQTTSFYHTDLKVQYIKFTPGPGVDAITVQALKSMSWDWIDNIITPRPQVAPKLPLPPGLSVPIQQTQAGALVQAVDSCSTFEAAVTYTKDHNISEARQIEWILVNNITLNPPDQPNCWQPRMINHTTRMFGADVGVNTTAEGSNAHPLLPSAPPMDPGDSIAGAADDSLTEMLAFGFNNMQQALQLPPMVPDKYFQIENVRLYQLPQGPGLSGVQSTQGSDTAVAPDVWTVLLWSIMRNMAGSPVMLSHVELVVPQPEYDFLQAKAQGAGSFAVQLTGGSSLLVTGAAATDSAVRLGTLQGPGLSGTNVWVTTDPAAAAAMPNYIWPLATPTAAAAEAAASGSSSNLSAGSAAGVGVGIAVAALLALLLLAIWLRRRRRHRLQQSAAAQKALWAANHSDASVTLGSGSAPGSNQDSKLALQLHAAGDDVKLDIDALDKEHCKLCREQLPAMAGAATTAAAAAASALHHNQGGSSLSHLTTRISEGSEGSNLGLVPSAAATGTAAGSSADTVQTGLQRWRAAINSTTITLMERRMGASQAAAARSKPSSRQSSRSRIQQPGLPDTPSSIEEGDAVDGQRGKFATAQASKSAVQAAAGAAGLGPTAPNLQLQGMLGQGSFGCVYLGVWHGKRVAVKVMQLPANALLGDSTAAAEQLRQQRNSPPHMAIMETVVSSTMSHPNVVQVYTYTLNPLTVDKGGSSGGAAGAGGEAGSGEWQGPASGSNLSGWELRLVMEYCDQGTLRDALSHRTLMKYSRSPYLPPCIALSLAHDVAAAMLHLHSEGVVHGDLKAANVLLTRGGEDRGNVWAATVGHRVTAKVADFGMALPLDPNDTHATMAARGTPTHMSPELFMSGHVSKASDVYAYGIMLYEIITGQRAYAGVPIPLLPHEVARQGLRPTWPSGLSNSYRDLQRLAEACWAQQPQDRPSFMDVFEYLESCLHGTPTADLLRRASSGINTNMYVSSPRAVEVVDQQLQGLKHSAERQLRLVKQASGQGVLPVTAAVVNGGDIAWSEVTYGGLPDAYEVRPMQQNMQPAEPQQHPQQEVELQQVASPAAATGTAPAKAGKPSDMAWSEVMFR